MIEARLAPHQLAARFRVRHRDGAAALAYLVAVAAPSAGTMARIEGVARLVHPHILPIVSVRPEPRRGCWLIAPYFGNRLGLTTLRDVLAAHPSGALPAGEATRLIVQLADASAQASSRGCVHGPLGVADVLVSARGRAAVELYGLGVALADAQADRVSLAALQARSLGRLAVRVLLGAETSRWRRQLARVLPPAVAAWIADMGDGCFADPSSAMEALPDAVRHIVVHPPEAGSDSWGSMVASPTSVVASASSSSAVSSPA